MKFPELEKWTIISRDDLDQIVKAINELIKKGWELNGPLIIKGEGPYYYFQAMAFYK